MGVLWPLPPNHGGGAKTSPQSGGGGGNQGWKSPSPRGSNWNNAGVGRRQALRRGESAPAGTQGLRGSRPTLRDQGPLWRKRRPPAPGPAGPARARVPGQRGLGPWRLQPQRACVSRCGKRLGPLSPWPPAPVETGLRTSAPIWLAPTRSPATPLAEGVAPAPGEEGGGGSLGEGSSGTEAEEGPKRRQEKLKMAARGRERGEGPRRGVGGVTAEVLSRWQREPGLADLEAEAKWRFP